MTETEFLISRALNVFNTQYGRDIKVKDCEIISIPNDPQSNRAYEITTPGFSDFFRIHLYMRFDLRDTDIPARLEVTMPYMHGQLGDEVFVIRINVATSWRDEGYRFDPITPGNLPFGVIVQEDGKPIVTEAGRYMVMEYTYPD